MYSRAYLIIRPAALKGKKGETMNNTIPIDRNALDNIICELHFARDNLYLVKNAIADEGTDGAHLDNALFVPFRLLDTNIQILEALMNKGLAEERK